MNVPTPHTLESSFSSLSEMASFFIGNSKRNSEPRMYWRQNGIVGQEGWITVKGTSDQTKLALLERGFQPLTRYGLLRRIEGDPDNPIAKYDNHFAQILCAPGGPEEFPPSQILAFRWYRPEFCPVPKAAGRLRKVLAQAGVTIEEFPCPDCTNKFYLKAQSLATHLRNSHQYDTAALIAYARENGISFQKEMAHGGRRVYTVDSDQIDEPEEDDVPDLAIVTHSARGAMEDEPELSPATFAPTPKGTRVRKPRAAKPAGRPTSRKRAS